MVEVVDGEEGREVGMYDGHRHACCDIETADSFTKAWREITIWFPSFASEALVCWMRRWDAWHADGTIWVFPC